MRKIGILGGSFDPIHNGHLAIAQDSILQFGLDLAFFMPTAQSPLKNHPPLAPAFARYKMIELAIQNHPKLDVLDWEILREGPSFTIDTVNILKKNWPHTNFYWIIGSDLLQSLPQWKDINQLVQLIEFIVVQRTISIHTPPPPIPNLIIHEINNPLYQISSSEIRLALQQNKPIDNLLPLEVKNYILINNLYESKS